MFTITKEEGSQVCNLASGVRLKNLSPPSSLKGEENLTCIHFLVGSTFAFSMMTF
jgi:hypothetical protein